MNSAIKITIRRRNNNFCRHYQQVVLDQYQYIFQKTSAFLKDKILTEEIIYEAIEIAQTEISPISDARGTEEYKRLLLGQLIKAHFITLFPEVGKLLRLVYYDE